MPQGQEKSGKTRKNDKSQEKMGVFYKKSGSLINLKKRQILLVQVYKILYFPKPLNGKSSIKNLLNSDLSCKIFLEIYKIT